jgi:drug/metabolite transporter (DMT)-like permease
MKIGLPFVEPMPYNALRIAAAVIVSWPILKWLANWQPLQRKDWKPLIISSVGFFFFQLFFTYGVQTTTAGNSSLVLGCLPLSVAVINHFHKFDQISKRMIVSIFVSLLGVMIMVAGTGSEISLSGVHAAGAVMLLIAQFAYGYYTVYSRILTTTYSTYQITAYILLISCILFLLISGPSLMAVDWEAIPPIAWVSILYSGLFPLCLGNALWIWGVKILGSARGSLYNNLPPFFAIIFGYLFLNEEFGFIQFIGAAAIFAGLYIARGVKPASAPEQSKSSTA